MPKIVHCIRHGQSTFNAHFAETGLDPMHPDAPLTELGRRQAAERAVELRQYPYELVVTSPLTRAIQTTMALFGSHPAAPPVHVECLHREHLESSCDVGSAPERRRRRRRGVGTGGARGHGRRQVRPSRVIMASADGGPQVPEM